MKKLLLLFSLAMLGFFALQAQDSTAYNNFHGQGTTPKRWISVPTPQGSNLRMTGSWTLENWVYVPDTVNSSQQIYLMETYGYNNTGGFVLRLHNLKIMTYQIAGPSSAISMVGNTMVQLNAWNHVAATYNDSSSVLAVYLNGVADGQVSCPLNTSNTNDNLYIGARGDDQNIIQNVTFDEVRIWDVARTETEISEGMNACLTGQESNLLLHYTFESINGIDVMDNTPNGNNGVLNNHDTISFVDGVFYCANAVGLAKPAENKLQAYPNPAKDQIHVSSGSAIQGIEIRDLQGSLVWQSNSSAALSANISNGQHECEVSLSGLPSGIYLLIAKTDEGIQHLKVVKE